MSEVAPDVVAAAPNGDAGGGQVAAPSLFESLKSAFGLPPEADEPAILSHLPSFKEKLSGYDAAKAEADLLRKQIAEARPSYKTPEAQAYDSLYEKYHAEGVAADKIPAMVWDDIQESKRDYMDIARSNPAAVIEAGIRKSLAGRGLPAESIEARVRLEMKSFAEPAKPDLAKYGGDNEDPEYVRSMEDWKQRKDEADERLRIAAEDKAFELNAARPKIGEVKPPISKEEQEAIDAQVGQKLYSEFERFATEAKSINVAGVDIPQEWRDEQGNWTDYGKKAWEFSAGGGLENMIYNPDGSFNVASRAKLFAQLQAAEKIAELGRSDALKQVVSNIQGGGSSPARGADGNALDPDAPGYYDAVRGRAGN